MARDTGQRVSMRTKNFVHSFGLTEENLVPNLCKLLPLLIKIKKKSPAHVVHDVLNVVVIPVVVMLHFFSSRS